MRIVSPLTLLGLLVPAAKGATPEEIVREHCLRTYILGMTEEIANDLYNKAGPDTADELEVLLYDCSFPRRDNVVAYMGFLSDGKALINALSRGTCGESTPEDYRAETLIPHVLGYAASKGHGRAKGILMSAMKSNSGGALRQAALRASDSDKRMIKLVRKAILRLAAGDEEMHDMLGKLARAEITPTWIPQNFAAGGFDLAKKAREVMDDMNNAGQGNTGVPGQGLSGFLTSAQGDTPRQGGFLRHDPSWNKPSNDSFNIYDLNHRRMIADDSPITHGIPLDFVNHVNIDNPVSNAEIDNALALVTTALNTDDGNDVACCILFSRQGNVGPFGSNGDGKDVIDTSSEIQNVLSDTVARVKVVDDINYCGGTGVNIIGCATSCINFNDGQGCRPGGFGMAIVRVSTAASFGKLIGHEYGHNAGLSHESGGADSRLLMYPSLSSSITTLKESDCDAFHSPPTNTQMSPENLGSCPLPPVGEGCTVLEDFENGSQGWTTGGSCTTGTFISGRPVEIVNGGVTTQVGGDASPDGQGNALYTASNANGAGLDDVDSGECSVTSPNYPVATPSTGSVMYFHGQRDAGGDPGGDFFKLEMSANGGSNWSPLVTYGDETVQARWTQATFFVPGGSSLKIRVSASDGTGGGDLVEAGIDNLLICPQDPDTSPAPPEPTNRPTSSPTTTTTNSCIVVDFDDGSSGGWTNNQQESSCSTGAFIVGSPQQVVSSGVTTQVQGDASPSGTGMALYTASNAGGVGTDDVDSGVCVVESPDYPVASPSTGSISWFHGQRDAGDDPYGDYFQIQLSTNGGPWANLIYVGDVTSNAEWRQATFFANEGSTIKIRVSASDGSGPGDLVEAGIDNLQICPDENPPSCTIVADFDDGTMQGWRNLPEKTCSTGDFIVGNPVQTSYQVGGDASPNGQGNALYTASNPNGGAGTNDVDGGECLVESPNYYAPEGSTGSLRYFHGQRDAGDDPSGDFFKIEMSTNGGISWTDLVSTGDVRSIATWRQVSFSVSEGSSVQFRVRAADGAGPGDLLEAGIDIVEICTPP